MMYIVVMTSNTSQQNDWRGGYKFRGIISGSCVCSPAGIMVCYTVTDYKLCKRARFPASSYK